MSFNRKLFSGILLAVCVAAFTPAPSIAAEAAPAGTASLTARQRQALSRIMKARQLGAAVKQFIWDGFDAASIPVLVVESRPGREPFALLVGATKAPKGMRLVQAATEDGKPSVYLGSRLDLPPGAGSPYSFDGALTALHRLGDVHPPPTSGDPSGELEILAIIHQMVHVHLALVGGTRFAHHDAPVPAGGPEATALGAVESGALADLLYSSPKNQSYIRGIAGQFLAARTAHAALLGDEAAKAYRDVEISEGPAVYTEYQLLYLMGDRQAKPPLATGPDDGGYDAFKYGVVWRMSTIIANLLDVPTEPAHVSGRAASTGAAICVALDRLRIDWRKEMASPKGPTPEEILERELALDATGRETALREARTAYGFDSILAVARELDEGRKAGGR